MTRTARSIVVALICCLFTAIPAAGDTWQLTPPEKVGMSSERLQRIAGAFKSQIDKGLIPGAVIAIARRGDLVYFEAMGSRDPATKAPMTRDAIFSLASMTKPMASVAVMILHDEGKLLLSDPVGKHLPVLANRRVGLVMADGRVETVPAVRQPTVQNLLRHTSGFPPPTGDPAVQKLWPPVMGSRAAPVYTGSEYLAALAKAPLLHQPGTTWEYGASTDVLGLVVEAISGEPLGSFLRERLWLPLRMTDAAFSVPDSKKSRYALAFEKDPATGAPQSVVHATDKPLKFDCANGCAVSTAMDYLRFGQMLLNNGLLDGQRVLAPRTVAMMTSNQLTPEVRARTTSVTLQE